MSAGSDKEECGEPEDICLRSALFLEPGYGFLLRYAKRKKRKKKESILAVCVCSSVKLLLYLLPKAQMCRLSRAREAEAENSALQLRLKRLNEEFRTRLVCYIQDLAVSVLAFGAKGI